MPQRRLRLRRLALLAPLLLPLAPRPAAAQDVMASIRAAQWPQAQEEAGRWLDPVARKLVDWYRLQAPGGGSVAEIDAFIQDNPDWPHQAALARAREQALAAEPDAQAAAGFCARLTLHLPAALLRCAEADRETGRPDAAAAAARAAWVAGITDPAAETPFLQRWGAALQPGDEWRRFLRLASAAPGLATRQIARLEPVRRREAEALLAIRRNDKRAGALLDAVLTALRHDPPLVLARLRLLRAQDQDAAALALWQSEGDAAQRDADPALRPAFWTERHALARALLQGGDAAGAYALLDKPGPVSASEAMDADFLAGWIALRRLNRPQDALSHFQALADASGAAITQGRAHYWLGRAREAAGDAVGAAAEYRLAAAWPTTFYGQLAALALVGDDAKALNARIQAVHDPGWGTAQAVAFAGREVARAAALLVAWGAPTAARPFLLQLEALAPDPADRAMAARFALGLGLPDQAVAIARRAGQDGVMLVDAGWPRAVDPPADRVDPAVTLGVIRLESSFDPAAGSGAGARGLMQLMPATAAALARRLGQAANAATPVTDPAENMRLGTAYLQELLNRFDGNLPLAVAAYNAGPGRVGQWLAAFGDPRTGPVDMVDWIELIPFNETRNYVQRVVENVTVYRARAAVVAPPPVAPAAAKATAGARG